MNKKRVDQLIPAAYQALRDAEIVDEGTNEIQKGFTGQISTFGASMMTGSVLATIAFFTNDNGASVKRSNILKGIEMLLTDSLKKEVSGDLFIYVQGQIREGNEKKVKEELIDCAVALKLAMNLYTLTQEGGELIES